MAHNEELVRPFVTYHAGVEHSIRMMGTEPWLFWRHPDGQWVSECPVSGPGLCWDHDDSDGFNHIRPIAEEAPDAN